MVYEIEHEIESLQKEVDLKLNEINNLKSLSKIYPNLKKHTSRWKQVRYYSKNVNSLVTDCDIRHSCGCCPDSPLYVWPYIETAHGKIYSDPPSFCVGEMDNYYADEPLKNWKELLKNADISNVVVEIIKEYFNQEKEKVIERIENISKTYDD